MSALDDVISVVITANTAAPTREGFGTPMIVGYHTLPGANRVRTYKRPSEMISDGFTTNDALYKAAVALCSQKNKVKNFKVGKRVGAPAQSIKLKLGASPVGAVHSVTLTLAEGTVHTATLTGTGNSTTDATSLAALIDAFPLVTATATTDTVTVLTTAAGTVTTFSDWSSLIQFTDNTADAGTTITTDLANIAQEDNDFYGLLLAVESEAIVEAAATWANSNKKLLGYCTSDYGVQDALTTTDLASDLKGSSYDHVFGLYCGKKYPSYGAAAWMGNRFPYAPGKSTWQFKTLVGQPVDNLSAAQINTLKSKNCNYYVSMANINVTQGGAKVASGEYIDVIHFLDWLVAEIQFRVYSIFVNSDKIPYTDTGIDAVTAAVLSALLAGVEVGGIAKDPAPTVTAPKAAEIGAATKASRDLPGVTAAFTLAGAIHTAEVEVTVSV